MKSIFVVLISFLLFISCSSDDEPAGDVEIRVENISQFNFNDVIVGSNEYGNVDTGEFSGYLPFEIAYRYGYIELESDGETYIFQPIDFVGETPLSPGQYTYQLDILDILGSPYIQLNFLED